MVSNPTRAQELEEENDDAATSITIDLSADKDGNYTLNGTPCSTEDISNDYWSLTSDNNRKILTLKNGNFTVNCSDARSGVSSYTKIIVGDPDENGGSETNKASICNGTVSGNVYLNVYGNISGGDFTALGNNNVTLYGWYPVASITGGQFNKIQTGEPSNSSHRSYPPVIYGGTFRQLMADYGIVFCGGTITTGSAEAYGTYHHFHGGVFFEKLGDNLNPDAGYTLTASGCSINDISNSAYIIPAVKKSDNDSDNDIDKSEAKKSVLRRSPSPPKN